MITRKLGKLLRGNATPFQLMAASILGTLLGFAPSFGQAPALYVILLALLLVANANLGLALMCVALGRLISLVAAPVSYSLGTFLLDGPTSGIAQGIVNAPVLAWCGFEYYAVAGGQLLGLMIGTLIGLGFHFTVRGIRRRMAAAQGNPSRAREIAAKPWARFMLWLFVGGTGKQTWEQKLAVRVGNPIRVWGALLMLVSLVGIYFAKETLAGPLASKALKQGLEGSSGATVDVGGLELEIGEGRLAILDLAMADAGNLNTDIFRAGQLEADVGQADFLRKRLHIERLVVKGAASGLPRATPGELTVEPLAEEAEAEQVPVAGQGEFSVEDLLKDYETWKQRLAQARQWMEKLSGSAGEEAQPPGEERKRRAERAGWYSAQAEHLVDEAPTFRLSELVVDDFESAYLPGRKLNLRGTELSTHPQLLDAPPTLSLSAQDGTFEFLVDLAPASKSGGDGALRFAWKGLQVDEVLSQLKLPGGGPFQGGTLEVKLDGAWDQGRIGWINLPLQVVLRDTTFSTEGIEATPVEELALSIGLQGPIDAPRIRFDNQALTDALVAAGKQELANRLKAELGGKLGGLGDKLGVDAPTLEGLEGAAPEEAKSLLKGLLGGKKD